MTRRHLLSAVGVFLLSQQIGTQVAAWQYQYRPILGAHVRIAGVPIYPPTGLVGWTWGLWWQAGNRVFDQRLRLAWTAAAIVAVLGGMVSQRAQQRHANTQPTTRWAGRRDLKRAGLLGKHGVVLGRYGRSVVRDDASTHVAIVGPTRSGKGENSVVPTLLGGWQHSALVYDPKGELYPLTAGYRSTFSDIVRCDPTSATTQGADLLGHVVVDGPTEHRDTLQLISRLTDPDGSTADHESATGKHFRELTNTVGQGLLLCALRQGHRTLPAIAQLLYATPLADLAQSMGRIAHPVVLNASRTLDGMDDQQLWGLLTTLQRAFAPFLDPAVARLVSRQDLDVQTLRTRQRPVTIYYTVPFKFQESLRGVTRLFFHTLFDAALAVQTGWSQRLLVLLDEVTTLRYFPLLADGFDFAAGYGMKLCVVTPSLNRLVQTYGPYHSFFEGAAVRLLFPPNTRKMARELSQEIGEQVVQKSRTSQRLGKPLEREKSVSVEETLEPLLSGTGLAQLSRDEVLLLTGDGPPAKLKKIRAWKSQPWKGRRGAL